MEEGLAETRQGSETMVQVWVLMEEEELLGLTFQDFLDKINLGSLEHEENRETNDDRLEMKIFLVSSEFRGARSSHHDS